MRAVLNYHSLDDSGSPISVHPDAFRRQAAWLASGKVRTVSVSDLVRLPVKESAVAVTFDDAFRSFRDIAWPLLREARIPVTVFVPTDHAGKTNRWPDEMHSGIPEFPLLGWSDLEALAEEGVVLGSHTRSHRDLRSLDDDVLRDELTGAAERLTEVSGRRPRVLAYPYGLTDDRVVAAASEVYDIACTDELRPLSPWEDLLRVPRLDAWYFQRSGLLELWGTRRLSAYLGLRRAGRRVHAASTRWTRRVQKRR